jgi:hypothetical protein
MKTLVYIRMYRDIPGSGRDFAFMPGRPELLSHVAEAVQAFMTHDGQISESAEGILKISYDVLEDPEKSRLTLVIEGDPEDIRILTLFAYSSHNLNQARAA